MSVAHPCPEHGVGQIFHGWDTHAATKRFREMIANSPTIKPWGHGPAQILKSYLDSFAGDRGPLELTWVLKFLLMLPAERSATVQESNWHELCEPESLIEDDEVHRVALVCVRREAIQMEDLRRRLVQFGRLFSVEVILVSSIG